jgi:tetratricopeptide (TPR) repeat protein
MQMFMLFLAASLAPETLDNYQQLLVKAQYSELEHQILQQDDYKQHGDVLAVYARSLFNQQRLEDANTLLNFATEQFPQHSNLHYLAGLSKIRLASNGNIFSAKDRATRGVEHLKTALVLNPDNYAARQALIDFYSVAPAAAGGDKELAQYHAAILQQNNPIQAALAYSRILLNEKKPEQALALIEQHLTEPLNAQLLLRKAQILNEQKQYPEAFTSFQLTAKYAEDLNNKYSALYHIGRLAVIADQDVDIGITALEQYLDFYQDSQNITQYWATLRLAQLMYRTNQLQRAAELAASLTDVGNLSEEFNLTLLSLLSALKPKEVNKEQPEQPAAVLEQSLQSAANSI